MQTRGQADAEDVSEDGERGSVGMPSLDGPPRERDPRDLPGAANDEAPLSLLRRLDRVDRGNRAGGGGNRAEVAAHDRERFLFLEVADHHGRRVVGVVEGVVKLLQARGRDAFDVASPADRRVVIGMLLERRREGLFVEDLEGGVLAPLVLVANDGHLRDPVRVPQERTAHPRRFDPDGDLDRVGGHGLVVVGAVERRGGVEPRPQGFEHRGDGRAFLPVVLGSPLEHEVLEEVGGAGVSHSLVAAADVIDDRERRDGGDRVREQQKLEPVRAKAELADPCLFGDEIERSRGDFGNGGRAHGFLAV